MEVSVDSSVTPCCPLRLRQGAFSLTADQGLSYLGKEHDGRGGAAQVLETMVLEAMLAKWRAVQ